MKNLYQIALQTVSPIKLKKNGEAGHVGCALETVGGVVFTGICIDVPCSIGICAEQAAIAEMLKNRETKIKRIVAVYEDGSILPPHEPEVDRPMLAYVKGDKFSLAVDAGYSKKHVQDFYRALRSCDLKEPDFTVITHWHYDHTFGLHDISGVSIAHQKTNLFLREQQDRANDKKYIDILKKDDTHFAKEYAGENELNIVIADIEYVEKMTLNLGNITAHIFHTV